MNPFLGLVLTIAITNCLQLIKTACCPKHGLSRGNEIGWQVYPYELIGLRIATMLTILILLIWIKVP